MGCKRTGGPLCLGHFGQIPQSGGFSYHVDCNDNGVGIEELSHVGLHGHF